MVLSEIRKSAREALTGKWGKGALITFIYMLFEFALGAIGGQTENIPFISLAVSIATIVISIPISYGLIISFMKLKRDEEVKCYSFITDGFANFTRSWKIAGNVLLKMWLPILLYVIATIVLVAAVSVGTVAGIATQSGSVIVIASTIGIALFIAAFIFLFVKSLYYALVYMVAYDNETLEPKDIVEESKNLMAGHRGKYVLLQLSFIGWVILSIFTLYIGLLWLVPYMQVALICFYEALKDKNVEE